MRIFPIFFLLTLLTLTAWKPANAQAFEPISEVKVNYIYGKELTFSGQVFKPENIKEIFLVFLVEDEDKPRGSLIQANSEGQIEYTYDVTIDPIPPFKKITYWVVVTSQNGETIKSQVFEFYYNDNQYSWQSIKNESVEVNWYSGDSEFGKNAYDILHQGILRISNLISINMDDPIRLYLYETEADLQKSLSLGGQSTVVPRLPVLAISISPGMDQKIRMEQEIPNELSHLLLYRKNGDMILFMPFWLIEGISSQVEIATHPEFDFAIASAMNNQDFISLMSLCSYIPHDPGPNTLAIAEASSFINYIFDQYGHTGLEKLIQVYTVNGSDCEQGIFLALGKSLSQLEIEWLQTIFYADRSIQTHEDFLPYLLLLIFILSIPLLIKPRKQIRFQGKK